MKWFPSFILLSIIFSCNNTDSTDTNDDNSSAPVINYTVTATFPHDTSSFTQGLEFYNGQLLEGTGIEGKSRVLQVDIKTGKPIKKVDLTPPLFGEGITVLNDTLYQLTWKNKIVLVYSAKDFKKIKDFTINTDGWGIANNGKELIASDGTSNLYFYEASTFRLLRTLGVTEGGSPAVNLNELEFINGFIYANQWQYSYILKIDPNSGLVVGKLDLAELVNRAKAKNPNQEFLNGIAYNPDSKKVYVTGKYWSELYEIDCAH
ncbi:MAG: glutaminyl-peptide cyclotransferase [Chitinophagaceae bacterium]